MLLGFSVNQPEKMDMLLHPRKQERKEVVVSKTLPSCNNMSIMVGILDEYLKMPISSAGVSK